jgi:hypothetical protein
MSSRLLSRLGAAGVAAAILGVLSAALMLAWPPQVPEGVLSYPFTPAGFRVIQTWFFIHHWGLVAVVLGFALCGGIGRSQGARAGAWLALAGTLGLTFMELFAIQFAEWQLKAANEGVVGAGYGIATSLMGLGMLAAGVGVLRAGTWTGGWRFVPLAIGIWHFAVATPAIFSNGYVIARLAIAGWIALFGALGWALLLEARRGR